MSANGRLEPIVTNVTVAIFYNYGREAIICNGWNTYQLLLQTGRSLGNPKVGNAGQRCVCDLAEVQDTRRQKMIVIGLMQGANSLWSQF